MASLMAAVFLKDFGRSCGREFIRETLVHPTHIYRLIDHRE
ncbi:MAG: hypothetical protein ACRER8_23455 [Pseudomonas sp.]